MLEPDSGQKLDALDWDSGWVLPNTALTPPIYIHSTGGDGIKLYRTQVNFRC
ncbi:MAG: hypothetical protein WD357_07630 [Gracilimonas sp.]